jgi:hypothetical protein
MISGLIRLLLGNKVGGFWLGLVTFLVGLGLTVGSYLLSSEFGGISVVFTGVMLVGLIRMATAFPSLFTKGQRVQRGRAAPVMPGMPVGAPIMPAAMAMPAGPSYMAAPAAAPAGMCWMCGGIVKPGNTICLHCGATLPSGGQQKISQTAQAAGFDPTLSGDAIPRYVGHGAVADNGWVPPSVGAPPGQYPGQPTYSPQAPYPGQPGYSPQPPYPGQPDYAPQPPYPGQPAYSPQPPYPGQPAYSPQPPYPGQPAQGWGAQPDQDPWGQPPNQGWR